MANKAKAYKAMKKNNIPNCRHTGYSDIYLQTKK